MTTETTIDSRVIYGLDDKPPFPRAFMLALQHSLTMFGSTVSMPLLFGPAMGMDQTQIATLISSVMLCAGVATFIQATFGSRLPIIQGVSFSFIGAFFYIITTVNDRGGSAGEAMQYIAGAIIVGAAFEAFVGFSGLMGFIRRYLSPLVVGPVIMLIGLALYQHGAPKAGTDWSVAGGTICLIILFSFVLSRSAAVFRLFPILLAILIMVGICWALTLAGVFKSDHPSYVNLEAFHSSSWIRANPNEVFFPWGLPRFEIGFMLAVFAGYLASMIESFGDYHACSELAGGGAPTEKQISRGIGCEGIGCALTGVLGGFSSTSYSENIGLIGLTKVGSRYVIQIAAFILLAMGLFAKVGALGAAIPGPIVGGLYCSLFGLISAVGIQQLMKCNMNSDRNLFVAGFALFMGLSVPAYFAAKAEPGPGEILAAYTPTSEAFLTRFHNTLASIIVAVGSSGMAVAAAIGLLLDNLLPGTPEERGIAPSS